MNQLELHRQSRTYWNCAISQIVATATDKLWKRVALPRPAPTLKLTRPAPTLKLTHQVGYHCKTNPDIISFRQLKIQLNFIYV